MSDGLNDALGRRTDYDPFRAKHRGKWGIWDSGYFYPDKLKKRKAKKGSK